MVDKNNNKSRGFGFITMKDPQRIEEILKTQPHTIDGKAVECKIAVPKENMVQQQQQQSQVQSAEKSDFQAHLEENSGSYNSRKIFVGGLPPLLKEGNISLKIQMI
jgi:RNA recognition motif-containing protein